MLAAQLAYKSRTTSLARPRWRPWLPGLALCLAVFALTAVPMLQMHRVPVWDAQRYFMPYYLLLADHVRQGQLLTWDPWSWGGQPAFIDPQLGAFSPVTLFSALLTGPSARGYIVYFLACWLWGAIGMMLFARHLRAPAWAATVVTLGFLHCGVYFGHAQHISWVVSCSFLPWIIWRLDAALRAQRLLPWLQAGALWGLSALSGYPAMVLGTGMFAGMWAVGRMLLCFRSEPQTTARSAASPSLFRPLAFAASAVLIGLVILAPIYVAFYYEGQGTNGRTANSADSPSYRLQLDQLPGLLTPFGVTLLDETPTLIRAGGSMFNASTYAGIGCILLAVAAFTHRQSLGWHLWILLSSAFMLILAMGQGTPLWPFLTTIIPPLRVVRYGFAFDAFFVFGIAALALMGSRCLGRFRHHRSQRRVGIMAVASLVAGIVLLAMLIRIWRLPPQAQVLPPLVCSHMLLWLPVAIALAMAAIRPKSLGRCVPALLLVVAIADAVLTMRATMHSDSTTLSRPTAIAYWEKTAERHSPTLSLEASLTRSATCPPGAGLLNNDNLITRRPVWQNYTTIPPMILGHSHPIWTRETTASEAFPFAVGPTRTWFAREGIWASPTAQILDTLSSATKAGERPPLILHKPEAMLDPSPPTPLPNIGAQARLEPIDAIVREYRPTTMRLYINAPEPGWLLVTDRWTRSWRAFVNNQSVTLYGGDGIFRAIKVPAGPCQIEFCYDLRWLWPLLALSWTMLAIIGLLSLPLRRRKALQ